MATAARSPFQRPTHTPGSLASPLAGMLASAALFAAACGGDSSGPGTQPAPLTTITYDVRDPCQPKAPRPNDVFRGADGVSEQAACTSSADAVENALAAVLADEGAPVDSAISLPIDAAVDAATLTATRAFSLTATSSAGAIPATLLFSAKNGTSTSTLATGWTVLEHSASTDGVKITLTPAGQLQAASYYVAVTTDAIRDLGTPPRAIGQAPATKLLVGTTPIAAGAYEGLDAATAARLERERVRLAPLVGLLEHASPPIARSHIRSISGFTTALGFGRTKRLVDAYHDAVTRGRITFQLTTTGGDLAPADVYPPNTPTGRYSHVQSFRRGVLTVPRFLDDAGHLRPDFATDVQTIAVPFLVSIPTGGGTAPYRMAIYLPGFGRAKLDAREIANSFAGAPGAAVLGVDLRCHGDRSRDAAGLCKENRTPSEIAALTDTTPNGNPERTGPDGIPDDSGAGFFGGDARAFRDGQIAAVLEVVHIAETFQRGGAVVTAAGLNPSPTDIHLIGHGHAAPIAVLAAALTRAPIRTVSVPSGGAGKDLVLGGPAALKSAVVSTLPAGLAAADLERYLTALESRGLGAISIAEAMPTLRERYLRTVSPRILLSHGEAAEFVPTAARAKLIGALGLDTLDRRVSEHHGECDDFYLHTCHVGDTAAWSERARDQLASFAGSGGVTVLDPAE